MGLPVHPIAFIQHLLTTNPMFAGMAGMGVMGGLMFQLRSIPQRLWQIFTSQFVLTLTVHDNECAYRELTHWLSRNPDTQKSRRLGVAVVWDEAKQMDKFVLTPGEGLHMVRHRGRRILLRRTISQPGAPGAGGVAGQRQESLTLWMVGRNQKLMADLMAEVRANGQDPDTIAVFAWTNGGYMLVERRVKRDLSTVYMDEAQKTALIADIKRFLARKPWYAERCIPWRRGYLLEGPPGTGKSTLIFAIACLLDRAIYTINPAILETDQDLAGAMASAGAGLVVIEDIDSIEITNERGAPAATPGAYPMMALPTSVDVAGSRGVSNAPAQIRTLGQRVPGKGLTLSGFLNAIDGITAREGRILFITTNHPDALDKALLRPGRIDRREHLGLAQKAQAVQMFARFFPEGDADAFGTEVEPMLPASPAKLQELLLARNEDFAPANDEVEPAMAQVC